MVSSATSLPDNYPALFLRFPCLKHFCIRRSEVWGLASLACPPPSPPEAYLIDLIICCLIFFVVCSINTAEGIWGPEITINKSTAIPDGKRKELLEHALLFIAKMIFTWATLKKYMKSSQLKIRFKPVVRSAPTRAYMLACTQTRTHTRNSLKLSFCLSHSQDSYVPSVCLL